MSDDRLEKLINQCKSSGLYPSSFFPDTSSRPADVDSRVDAVIKLQAEFEAGVEVRI